MALGLNPYLNFPGTAREAMTFYQSVLGGTLEISTFGQYGAQGAPEDGVMHAYLGTDSGLVLMASDLPPGMPAPTSGGNVSVSISGDDEKIRDYWAGLSEGAEITLPFERQMWGDEYGQLTDRFGIQWMLNLGSGEQSS